jgi:hypothetical protein
MGVAKDWRSSNRTIQILKAAHKGKYGVIAAIAYNLEQIYGSLNLHVTPSCRVQIHPDPF